MGSGRGVSGMRERATALGGTLTAGPRPGGGWRVRAVLPRARGPGPARRRLPGAEHAIDLVLVLLALFPAVGGLLAAGADPAVEAAPVPLLVLVAAAHAVPVFWRRARPWTVLGAVAVTTWALPVLIAAGVVPPGMGWVMLAGLAAEAVAVYAVARYGRPANLTALAIPLALSSAVLATGVDARAGRRPRTTRHPVRRLGRLPVRVHRRARSACRSPAAWLAGFLVRRRHTRIEAREHDAVAASTAHAIMAAGLERARVAAGLRAAVLRDTARVATAADAGDLDQVLLSARAALDAMRGLLNGLRDEPDAARDSPRTRPAADHGGPAGAGGPLARRRTAGGPGAARRRPGAARGRGPVGVPGGGVAAGRGHRAGHGPGGLTGDPLRISMRPMPADEGGEIAAGLRARLAAVGGSMATAADGLPEMLLPAPPAAHPDDNRPVLPRQPTVLDGPAGSGSPAGSAGPAGSGAESSPVAQGAAGAESIPAGNRPGTPAGDDKEVASSPSG